MTMKNRSGFTLIEVMIVVCIIGILGAVAWPYYKGHIVKARLTEVERTMMVIKSAVSSYYEETNGLWPTCGSISEISSSLGVSMTAVDRVSSGNIQNNGVITCTIQYIDPLVDGEFLMLTPSDPGDGSVHWTWGYSAGFPMHLRPKGN